MLAWHKLRAVVVTAEGRLNLVWRVLLYLALYFAAVIGAGELAYLSNFSYPFRTTANAVLQGVGILALTYVWRRFVDQRAWQGMKLPLQGLRSLRQFIWGFLIMGVLTASPAVIGLLSGWLHFHRVQFTPEIVTSAVTSFIFLLSIGFIEELAFRGYLFQNLGERFPVWLATLLCGVTFGVVHFFFMNFNGQFVILTSAITAFFVATRLATGSLWFAIGAHTVYNWFDAVVDYPSKSTLFRQGESDAFILLMRFRSTLQDERLFLSLLFVLAALVITWVYGTDWRTRLEPDGGSKD